MCPSRFDVLHRGAPGADGPEPSLTALVAASPDIVACFDRSGRHLFVNDAVRRAGIDPGELLGRTNREAGLPEGLCAQWDELLDEVFRTGEVVSAEFAFPSPEGTDLWYHAHLVPQRGADGEVELAWGVTRDVTAQVRRQDALASAAASDPLTGVANRRGFLDAVRLAGEGDWALLFIDLDDFRRVNNEGGHRTGDQVLAAVAGRITSAVRPGDLVARWGGDEFVVACAGLDLEQAAHVAERILGQFADPFVLDERRWDLGATLGVAAGTGDVEGLIAAADGVLREGKAAGKSVVRLIHLP